MPGATSPTADLAASLLDDCREAPDLFNHAVLGRKDYWWRQVEICEAVVAHKVVVVPTGNSVGKSYLAAGLILWWLLTRPGSQVVVTAPSQTLLGTVLFKELRRAVKRSILPIGGKISDSPAASPQVFALDAEGWGCLGVATTGVERLSGQHDANLLHIVDEGSGVADEIWEALKSQNPLKQVVFGNPIRAEGRFKLLHERALREKDDPDIPAAEKCVSIRIPSTDSPDIDEERSPRGLADRGFITEVERDYGRDSLYWRTHVAAEFPDADHDQLVPEVWIDRCAKVVRPDGVPKGKRRLSIDLSAGVGGDSTVLLIRDSLGVLHMHVSNRMGVPEAAHMIQDLAARYHVRQEDIVYDAGGPGKDLPRYLEQYRITEAVAYHGGGKGGPKATNKRSKMAWRLRQRLDPERPIPLPEYREQGYRPLEANAGAPRPTVQPPFHIPGKYLYPQLKEEIKGLRYSMRGPKVELECKEDLMKKLGRSPDRVDALLMSFHEESDA